VINRRGLALWGGLALVLGTVDVAVARKEWLRAHGRPLLLELAPRDPRSLIQGDYMRLDYALSGDLWSQLVDRAEIRGGMVVVRVDARGVARFARLSSPGQPLAPDERLLRFRRRNGELRVGPAAFFFQEGQGEVFARARFAEVRVDSSGDVLLIGLRDASTRPLP
jgi:uncharacterized membrane-anchored protein